MGTLGLRLTLRSHRCDVGSIGLASRLSPLLDRCLHGSRAIRRNGIQPLGGGRTRWKKPSDKDARDSGGQLTRGFVGGFTVVTSLLFLIYAAQLNRLTLLLAPAELGLILLYSYTKRFTRWSHLVLGLVLGSTPAAAWMARPSGRMEEPASSDWYRQCILARASRMNAVFFAMNGVISIVFFIFVAADILVRQTARVPSK